MEKHVLYVCTTCAGDFCANVPGSHAAPSDALPDSSNKRGGERLLEQLQTLGQTWDLQDTFAIEPVKCMGVCERDCAIAFVASGKRTYLFGNLPTANSHLDTTASAILHCASQYYQQPDGTLSYHSRPELLKTRVLARIPPSL
jgi:predicted metal-binding protein